MARAPAVRRTPEPWQPAAYDESVTANVKALFSDEKYTIATNWILFELCRIGDLSFREGKQDVTNFAEGKRFVGLQIAKQMKLRPAKVGGFGSKPPVEKPNDVG